MSTALVLPRELTIYTVAESRSAWLNWLACSQNSPGSPSSPSGSSSDFQPDGSLAVDAHAVEEIDAAGVQLLLALSHTAEREHLELRWLSPSPALQGACQAMGLTGLLARADQPGVQT